MHTVYRCSGLEFHACSIYNRLGFHNAYSRCSGIKFHACSRFNGLGFHNVCSIIIDVVE